jgi:hypothetical protein
MNTPTSTTNYAHHDGSVQDSTMNNPNRKSQLFFGICDMRTATVALNIINIAFTVIVAIIMMSMYAFGSGFYRSQAISSVLFWAIIITVVSGIGLYSAMTWRLDGMYVSTAGFAIILLARIIKLDFIDLLVTAFLLYPHIVFTMEMRSGIMTPENFDEEEYVTEGGRDFVEMAHQYISPTFSQSMTSP